MEQAAWLSQRRNIRQLSSSALATCETTELYQTPTIR